MKKIQSIIRSYPIKKKPVKTIALICLMMAGQLLPAQESKKQTLLQVS